ncbi:MAG: TolC family protein [Candidatus Omnitrophica bacterium]|nr:TolC family protein [Candidatus Omnitrophota bacterium]
MTKKLLVVSLMFVFVLRMTVFAQDKTRDTLELLLDEALVNNLKLRALNKEWESKKARITAERSLPQPEVGFGFWGESVETKAGPMKRKYSIKQAIPYPGKLWLKGDIAQKEAAVAYARYILEVRGVIENLKSYFYDYFFVVESVHIMEAEKLILEGIRSSIKSKYETLSAPQQDLVKVDLEIAKIEDKILKLNKQKNLLRAQINRILNRPQNSYIKLPLGFRLLAQRVNIDKNELLDKAYAESPHIIIDLLMLEKQKDKFSLAKQGYIPDFGIMAEYIDIGGGTTNLENDGQDAWMIGFQVKVPLWFWKVRSEISSEKAKLEAQEYQVEDKENFLSFKIEDLHFRLETEEQLIDLYKNVILPESMHNFSVSRIGYEDGVVDFLSFLDAERSVISIKIAELKQTVDYMKTVAQIEYIIGEDL